jgi:hypothetical protein
MSKTNSNDKPQVQYPFTTKKQIADRVATSDKFAVQCLEILRERTATRKPGQKSYGFMSSHVKKAAALEHKDLEGIRALVGSYTKQLAAHFRAEEIAENPELEEVAKIFSAG